MGASVVPGYPAFTVSEAGNGSAIAVASAAAIATITGTPIVGDVIHAVLLLDGVAAPSTDTVTATVGATPTDTTVATTLSAAIGADVEWTALLTPTHSTNLVTSTLVAGQRSKWGRYSIKFTTTLQGGSTLVVSPATLFFTPTGGSGIVSVIPLTTFPYSANGQQMTFYKGQITDMPLPLARELYAAKLVQ